MALDLFIGPWDLIRLLIIFLAVIVFAKLTVILLAVLREVLAALIKLLLAPIQVIRGTYDDTENDDGADRGQNPVPEPDPAPDPGAVVADGGEHEPPPNVLWPPAHAFEEDDP